MNLYVVDKKDLINPYVSPLCETNFKHMPKTLIITAELDPLRDEGRKYAEILIIRLSAKLFLNSGTLIRSTSTPLIFSK